MYYYIKGKLIKKEENFLVIENNGIGYKINTSLTSINEAGENGEYITIYTYLHIREDLMELYGFITEEEKKTFLMLLNVSGVGPKAALAILSVVSPTKLALAVVTDDTKTITKAQGVGAKMAQRVILELKDKLKNVDISDAVEDSGVSIEINDTMSEAISALIALGYTANDARNAVEKAGKTGTVEEIIKRALVQLM